MIKMTNLLVALFSLAVLSGCITARPLRSQREVDAMHEARIRSANPNMRRDGRDSAIARGLGNLFGMNDNVGMAGLGDCPPQGVAMLDRPVRGCDAGALLVMVKNQTEYTMRVYIDGEQLSVNGETVYEGIPPRSNAWVFLEETGMHTISGEAFAPRGMGWTKVDEFDTHAVWNHPRGADNFHVFHIDRNLLRRY